MVNANRYHTVIRALLLAGFAGITTSYALADATSRAQAARIYDRLTGVPPTAAVLNTMESIIDSGSKSDAAYVDAAYEAMKNKNFYNVTLVNMVTPWTNEEQAVIPLDSETEGTLNDYTATVIGAVRDDLDFRRILFDDILYVANDDLLVAPYNVPAYSYSSNAHYKTLETLDVNLGGTFGSPAKDVLVSVSQASKTGGELTPAETAGVITTRAGAKAFFTMGTNRAMFRFTMLNHLCNDMEQVKDVTRTPDRIQQDVSRSPGGDSRIFFNACLGCHSGMDPMNQAFAYYNYDDAAGKLDFNASGELDPDTGTRVKKKYRINEYNFVTGYKTVDDSWINYWRNGPNKLLGWDQSLQGSGNGAKSMAQELAYSEAFAQCQVKKVFQTVCLRAPVDSSDRAKINDIVAKFKQPFKASGYELKRVFAEAATYCK